MDITYYIWENGDFVPVTKNRFYEQMRYYKYNRVAFYVSDYNYYSEPEHKDKFLKPLEFASK